MSSPKFPCGGASDFYDGAGGFHSQSTTVQPTRNNHPATIHRAATIHRPLYQSQPSIMLNHSSHIAQHQTSTLIEKRTITEFQTHNLNLINNNNNPVLSNYLLRSVKPNTFQHANFSTSNRELSTFLSQHYDFPVLHHLRPNVVNTKSVMNLILPNTNFPRVHNRLNAPYESKKNSIDHRLQELEKKLIEDNEDKQGDIFSVIATTTSTWSHTIHNLFTPHKPTSLSSTSSMTLSNTYMESTSSIRSLIEAAVAISEGRFNIATEILARLSQNSNQHFVNCMVSALKSRMNHVEHPPPVVALFSKEHAESTQLLLEHSFFFKVARIIANIAIIESALTENGNLCVVDFDIGDGNQYVSLLNELFARQNGAPTAVKIIMVTENDTNEKMNIVGMLLGRHAEKLGIAFEFKVLTRRIVELTRESLGCDVDEVLAVNFAYKLYKIPDESVSTNNLRDELLRRVKALAPRVVTLVEQEANINTSSFVTRVSELCSYYNTLFDSLESTMSRENSDRVKIEEGLSRKIGNSVACEGVNRVERCEVFGKWCARMSMAGFKLKPVSRRVARSIKVRLGDAGNQVTIKIENGGICFGWMGRTLTVTSVWY